MKICKSDYETKRLRILRRFKTLSCAVMVTIIAVLMISQCSSCKTPQTYNVSWEDSIKNPANLEYLLEIGFSEQIKVDEVTQKMFIERYFDSCTDSTKIWYLTKII